MSLSTDYTDEQLNSISVLENLAQEMAETAGIAADNGAQGAAAHHRLMVRLIHKLIGLMEAHKAIQ